MIVKVPNYASFNRRIRGRRWCGYRFPEHVNYFTPDTLTAMLEQCGFAIERCNLSDRFPLNDNLWVIARKAAMSARRAA